MRAFVRLRAGRAIRERESDSDVVQSVCRKALEELRDFEYRGEGAFRQWLFTIALRKIIDRHRSFERERAAGHVGMPALQGSSSDIESRQLFQGYAEVFIPSQNAVLREDAETIERAFDQLEDEYREVLLLSRVFGLTRREIAEEMSRSEEVVKKLLARAQARFALLLAGAAKSSTGKAGW